MMIVLTVLFAFPLGYLIRGRGIAIATFLGVQALLFTYQSLTLTLDWVGGSETAFGGPFPDYTTSNVIAYGVVNLVVVGAGVGLLALGARVAAKRSRSRAIA